MATCRVGRLVPKSTVVFLCDMQEKFRQSIQYFSEIVQVSSRVLKVARILNIPVFVTEQYPKGLGSTVNELGLSEFPDIKPYEKTQFSMLTSDLMTSLRKTAPECKSVVLCGIETHVCIQGTTMALLEQGFDVHIVVDGCSSRTIVDRMYAFERMKASGAWLTTSESIILGLVGDAAHPQFKEVQKVIKTTAPDSALLTMKPQIMTP